MRSYDLHRWRVSGIRIACVLTVFLVWQFGPQFEAVQDLFPFMDEFFISTPRDVAIDFWQIVSSETVPVFWSLLARSGRSFVFGGLLGVFSGMLLGLVMSHFPFTERVFSPFMAAFNAAPRLAFVPLFIIVFGATLTATLVAIAISVFFLTFFSAFAGARALQNELLLNASLLGATEFDLLRIRWKYVTVWTFAAMPNILTSAFIAGLTTEIISTAPGVGQMIRMALERLDATRTVALAILLALIGAGLAYSGRLVGRWRLHWHEGSA